MILQKFAERLLFLLVVVLVSINSKSGIGNTRCPSNNAAHSAAHDGESKAVDEARHADNGIGVCVLCRKDARHETYACAHGKTIFDPMRPPPHLF